MLSKIKDTVKKPLIVLTALLVGFISIPIQPTYAAFPMIAPELLFAAFSGAAGISFDSTTDITNAYQDATAIHPDLGRELQEAVVDLRTDLEMGSAVNVWSNDFLTNPLGAFQRLADAFTPYYTISGEKEVGILTNEMIKGYLDGEAVMNAPNSMPDGYFNKLGVSIRYDTGGNAYLDLNDPASKAAFDRHNSYKYIMQSKSILYENTSYELNNRAVFQYNRITTDPTITESKPFTATLAPDNIITQKAATITKAAKLANILDTGTGSYAADSKIGIKVPKTLEDAVGLTQESVVVPAIDITDTATQPTTAPTTQPTTVPTATPGTGDNPVPTAKPIDVTNLLPPILAGMNSIMTNFAKAIQTAKNTAKDNGALERELTSVVSDMARIKTVLEATTADDPEVLTKLAEAQSTIADLEKKLSEQVQTVVTQPVLYPDVALQNELAAVEKELADLKASVAIAIPQPVAPTDEGDYTGVLGSILGVLTGIGTGIAEIPEKVTSGVKAIPDAIVGDMTLERTNKDVDFDITMVFPFCIPFDLIRMFESLQGGGSRTKATGGAPVYTMELMGYEWVLDFVDYTYIRDTARWGLWVSFVIGLMIMTGRVIKWG